MYTWMLNAYVLYLLLRTKSCCCCRLVKRVYSQKSWKLVCSMVAWTLLFIL